MRHVIGSRFFITSHSIHFFLTLHLYRLFFKAVREEAEGLITDLAFINRDLLPFGQSERDVMWTF